MPPIRIGLIGFGYWGPNLARNFHAIPDFDLAAISDLDPVRLQKARDLYRATRFYDDPAELLASDVEAVAIATPARSHFDLACAALDNGKHVFVEKPLAMQVAEAEELVRRARAAGRVLMVGHVFEYNQAVRHMKTLLDGGSIGAPYYFYSTRVNLGRIQSDVNALWSIAPHDICILIYLLDQMPAAVTTRGARYLNGKVEDVVFLILDFPDGVLAHVHASWLDPSKTRRMTVVGSHKMIVYDELAAEGKVKLYDKGVIRATDPQYGEYQYRIHSGDIAIPKLPLIEPLRLECEDFAHAIQTGEAPLADGESGLRVVRVLAAAQRSLELGGQLVPIS